jgi:hypothetical protein
MHKRILSFKRGFVSVGIKEALYNGPKVRNT